LQRVDSLPKTDLVVLILGRAAVVSELADFGQQLFVVAGYRAGIAIRAEVLSRIKTEAGDVAYGPATATLVLGAMSLRRVFDQP